MPRHSVGCVCFKCKPFRVGSNPPPPRGAKPLPPPNPPRDNTELLLAIAARRFS